MQQEVEPQSTSPAILFEGDPDFLLDHHLDDDDDADCPENLSIPIHTLLSFLDEPMDSSTTSSSDPQNPSKDFVESSLTPINVNTENGPQPQKDNLEPSDESVPCSGEHGSSQWTPSNCLNVSGCREGTTGRCLLDVPGDHGNCNDTCPPLFDCAGFYNSSVDNNSSSCQSHGLPSDWLRLSSSDYELQHSARSANHLSSTKSDYKQFNDVSRCSTDPHNYFMEEPNHYTECTDSANFVYMENGGQELTQAGAESPFQMEFQPTKGMVLAPSSLEMLENGGTGHDTMLMKDHDPIFGIPESLYRYEAPVSLNLGENAYMPPSSDAAPVLLNIPHAEVSTSQATDIMFGINKNFALVKSTAGHVLPSHYFQPFASSSSEATTSPHDEKDSQWCASLSSYIDSEAKPSLQEAAFDTSSPEIPIVDLDRLFPDLNYQQDMPLPFGGYQKLSSATTGYSEFTQVMPKAIPEDQIKKLVLASAHDHHRSINDVTQVYTPRGSAVVDEDFDVCIIDDISTSSNRLLSVVPIRSHVESRAGLPDTLYPGDPQVWPKAHDERLTYRIALQDLSQPKSEASPPDGVLAVPLMRHQRIALSWMVQKETSNLNCSGGILADDQGLGKTISTIALILAERSPSSKNCSVAAKQVEVETLDDDDEDAPVNGMDQPGNSDPVMTNSTGGSNSLASLKGRPAAGTLVVCPTSVLRQWADELQNKVTSKGNLSFLVYHGSNRTKDPIELSRYDVVLTTYSIVSMEVPKQLYADKDDEEKGKPDALAPPGSSTSRKRKNPPSSKSKNGKMSDSNLLESTARPLARVAWFRVILDEAQTIKNHRTQVARACCGLRAKRRWCLSGTPIQNAIDDLYSYFRFLRYDPYAVYKSFCSTIKMPINKNPTIGYKKLQAVLKTIMLRRTKGTRIDGEPIIQLPTKSITLKKVDFSQEERSFYSRLEAESREQFKVYADAGTVKQNYVNILLMLLRLRQACDHPLLVKGYDSNSIWKDSGENAKKLPRDKQLHLLSCLEACLAICAICSDPPEDAVVAICGHVFCNQCVCEHLTGDDKHCPSPDCRIKLDAASVFPKASLKSSLSGLPGDHISQNGSCHELVDSSEPHKDVLSSDSSKIKAAVEILQSLPILKDDSSIINSNQSGGEVVCVEKASKVTPVTDDMICSYSEESSDHPMTEKAIVFSQWTRMLDLLEARLKSSCIKFRRLDGTMSVTARDKAIKDFNTKPEINVMIMSLKAASLGLNMVSACHVLLLDLWWNPTTEDQAIDRAHRIGQTRPVTVSRLTVKDTVEDRILALQEKKREMVAYAFGEDKTGSHQTRLTVEDLNYLFMM